MIKKLMVLTVTVLFLLSACSGSVPPTPTTPAVSTTEPYPAGAYPPVGQPVDTGAYPEPGIIAAPLDSGYPAPGDPSVYDPQAADATLERVEVTVDLANSNIMLLETSPVQAVVRMIIQMPTPCHLPRAKVSAPDAKQNIAVEVYAVVDPNTICTQVISQIEVRVSLGSLTSGIYHVVINGQTFEDVTIN